MKASEITEALFFYLSMSSELSKVENVKIKKIYLRLGMNKS
jgi:hypothetical protein